MKINDCSICLSDFASIKNDSLNINFENINLYESFNILLNQQHYDLIEYININININKTMIFIFINKKIQLFY